MSPFFVPVLVASVAGSLHCAAMCGPFVAAVAGFAPAGRGGYAAHAAYHLGRLATYLVLGGAAALAGQALDLAGKAAGFASVSAVVAGGLLVLGGLSALASNGGLVKLRRHAPKRFGTVLGRWLGRIRGLPRVPRALLLGLSTTLVPCGWLYVFVATAAAAGRFEAGAFLMFAFWLGTLPALVAAGVGLQKLVATFGAHARTASAALAVAAGVLVLSLRAAAPPGVDVTGGSPKAPASCPLHPH